MAQLFVSYSRKHPVYADFLIEDLERDGYTSWIDRSDIIGGESWRQSIYSGIEGALVVLLIVTEEALKSDIIQQEIAYAVERGKPAIPLFMQRLDMESALRHWNLEHAQAIDFVVDRRKDAYAKLLLSLKQLTDTWSPLAKQIDRLGHFSPKVRQEAAERLGASQDIRVLEALIEAIRVEPDEAVWKAMLWQLRNFQHPTSLSVAMEIVNSGKKHNPGKLTALRVLQEIGIDNDRVADILLRLLNQQHKDWLDIIASAEALYKFSDPELKEAGFRNIVNLLKADNADVRASAAVALGKLGDRRASMTLESMITNEPDEQTRKLAEHALAILVESNN